ncbi:ribose-phosphate pyrophosphokinase [Pedobacter sp. SYP-B3415]|uniref:ribose-phosphate diphosphokinase n=1 Tax=Pedobacter sp. SYP-B3415 TaxID=2496641 RepID=UPI00101E15FA|nr:ribose-phosphate diphosphokinase [Pedobacter sp. SYP-B3415]
MKRILFAIKDYMDLAGKVKACGDFEDGILEVNHFSDGERYQRIISVVENRDVVLLGGTVSDEATLELYDLACSFVSYGADSLTIVIPYFGYSTMERSVLSREVVTAKTRARLLSSIPKSNRGNKVLLFDLHAEGIQYYFEHDLYPVHVYCKQIVMAVARQYGGNDFVMASADAGRAKWVESLANDLGVNAAFILKRRLKDDNTEVSAVNADVAGRIVIIYDDMIRSGGSIINAAKTYKEAGASRILVITTHGLFVNQAIDKMRACGVIEKIICTDSHINALKFHDDDFVEIHSLAKLISDVIS